MSWAEVMKINNDMNEPLNYQTYLNNISMFGEDSYIISTKNSTLWDEFSLKSNYLYAHTQLHDIVYNRLSDENIDNLFNKSSSFGNQLNFFYDTTIFPNTSDELCSNMDDEKYTKMEDKFKSGYLRYFKKHFQSETCGVWVNTNFSFNDESLKIITSYDELIDYLNTNNLLFSNSSLIYGLSRSGLYKAIIENLTNEEFINTMLSLPEENIKIFFKDVSIVDTLLNITDDTYENKFNVLLTNETLYNLFVGDSVILNLYSKLDNDLSTSVFNYIISHNETNSTVKTIFFTILFEDNEWLDIYFADSNNFHVLADSEVISILGASVNGMQYLANTTNTELIEYMYSVSEDVEE
jgi:uncharacterized protein YjgD (DUF1641 family)